MASQNLDALLSKSMALVHRTEPLDAASKQELMLDAINNWKEHVNPGFLQYRKSVAAGNSFAAIEWRDGPDGCTVLDAEGKVYVDCLGGFGIFNVGRSHPKVIAAVKAQLDRMPLHSQELLDPLRGYAAAALAATMPPPNSGLEEDRLKFVFFTSSGAESVEACLKMAVLSTGRKGFFALQGAFHGKTLGALGGTSKAAFRGPFLGATPKFTHLPRGDIHVMEAAFRAAEFTGDLPAGFIMEPILGEGGIHVLGDAYLQRARELCTQHGVMLIFDEVQSGMGRSGRWWACEYSGVAPDLMAVAKAFGGGVMPAGACIGSDKAWAAYKDSPFTHTTTFGGNPLSMAAALAGMSVIQEEHLCEKAARMGELALSRLRGMQAAHPTILKEVRGRGLLVGLEFHDDAIGYRFSRGAFASGVLLSGTLVNARTVRFEPSLTMPEQLLLDVMRRFEGVLEEMEAEARAHAGPAPIPAQAAPVLPQPVTTTGGAGALPLTTMASPTAPATTTTTSSSRGGATPSAAGGSSISSTGASGITDALAAESPKVSALAHHRPAAAVAPAAAALVPAGGAGLLAVVGGALGLAQHPRTASGDETDPDSASESSSRSISPSHP